MKRDRIREPAFRTPDECLQHDQRQPHMRGHRARALEQRQKRRRERHARELRADQRLHAFGHHDARVREQIPRAEREKPDADQQHRFQSAVPEPEHHGRRRVMSLRQQIPESDPAPALLEEASGQRREHEHRHVPARLVREPAEQRNLPRHAQYRLEHEEGQHAVEKHAKRHLRATSPRGGQPSRREQRDETGRKRDEHERRGDGMHGAPRYASCLWKYVVAQTVPSGISA